MSYEAGKKLAQAIIEMVHLMYQNKTATNFYRGLNEKIKEEMERRHLEDKNTGEKGNYEFKMEVYIIGESGEVVKEKQGVESKRVI